MAKKDPAAQAKEAMARIVGDVWRSDPRLGDPEAAATMAERVTTVGLDGPVFQGQHFYDAVLARGVPHDPLVEALIAVAAYAAQKKIGARMPKVAQHVAPEKQKQIVARVDPPKAANAPKPRRRWQQPSGNPRRIALGVVAAIFIGATAASFPISAARSVQVKAPAADEMPCDKPRVSLRHLFCTVTSDVAGNDAQIRARIVKSQRTARLAGFDAVVFLQNDAPYKPALWGADPAPSLPALDRIRRLLHN